MCYAPAASHHAPAALKIFAEMQLDVVVLEVGWGGGCCCVCEPDGIWLAWRLQRGPCPCCVHALRHACLSCRRTPPHYSYFTASTVATYWLQYPSKPGLSHTLQVHLKQPPQACVRAHLVGGHRRAAGRDQHHPVTCGLWHHLPGFRPHGDAGRHTAQDREGEGGHLEEGPPRLHGHTAG